MGGVLAESRRQQRSGGNKGRSWMSSKVVAGAFHLRLHASLCLDVSMCEDEWGTSSVTPRFVFAICKAHMHSGCVR